MPSRRLHPDRAIEIALHGNATRYAQEGRPVSAAVEALRETAQGRTDLLAQAAGTILGTYLRNSGTCHPNTVLASGLLIAAGADPSATVARSRR